MPLKSDDVKAKSTKEVILDLLEETDEEGNLQWWSIREICEKVGKKSGTVHYHINPFSYAELLEKGHPKDSHLTPVYRIKPDRLKEFRKLKKEILGREKKVYKRAKLREVENRQIKRTVIKE